MVQSFSPCCPWGLCHWAVALRKWYSSSPVINPWTHITLHLAVWQDGLNSYSSLISQNPPYQNRLKIADSLVSWATTEWLTFASAVCLGVGSATDEPCDLCVPEVLCALKCIHRWSYEIESLLLWLRIIVEFFEITNKNTDIRKLRWGWGSMKAASNKTGLCWKCSISILSNTTAQATHGYWAFGVVVRLRS